MWVTVVNVLQMSSVCVCVFWGVFGELLYACLCSFTLSSSSAGSLSKHQILACVSL